MQKSRKAVDVNANGSAGYMLKNGANKGRILKHLRKSSGNI